MGEVEHGKCDICKTDSTLGRKYYYYNIKCDCHSPRHFELVTYCSKCAPTPPERTTVLIKPEEN